MRTYDTQEMQSRRGAYSGSGAAASEQGQQEGFPGRYAVGYGRRPWAETKPFFLTSEFLTLAGLIGALAIAMGVLDNFDAPRGWLFITILGAANMVARGLAKSGTRDPNPDRDRGYDY